MIAKHEEVELPLVSPKYSRGATTKQGSVCNTCGGTERYKSSGGCVACKRASASGKKTLGLIKQRAQEARAKNKATFIHDVPCKKCGTKKRYAKGHGICVQCNITNCKKTRNKTTVNPLDSASSLSTKYLSMVLV